jgi:hypothetical protein
MEQTLERTRCRKLDYAGVQFVVRSFVKVSGEDSDRPIAKPLEIDGNRVHGEERSMFPSLGREEHVGVTQSEVRCGDSPNSTLDVSGRAVVRHIGNVAVASFDEDIRLRAVD